jgi:UDP-glucose 4-epimerase
MMTHSNECILVAGGAGFIGGHVVRLLSRQGFQVVIVDNFSNANRDLLPEGIDVVDGSKGDRELILRTLEEYKPIGIVDLGGYADIWEKKFTPTDFYENNVIQTTRFVETLLAAGVKAYVFSSSAMVYGATTSNPIPESHPRAPLTIYGRSIHACEDIVCDLFEGTDERYAILRYFSVAGAMNDLSFGQTMPNYYHIITASLNVAFGVVEKVNAYGSDFDTPDGTGITDYIHVQDLADIHMKALTRLIEGGDSDIINCGYGHGHSVLEITNAVSQASGKEIPTVFAERRGNFEGVSVVDNSKLINEWDWQPKFDDLNTIVKHAYGWRKQITEST